MGGTFDPPHVGHLIAASEVCDALDLDRVLFVPTGEPWQKAHRQVTDREVRCEMVSAAIRNDSRFELCRVDVDRSGATYAVDTVTDLKALHPDAQFWFIIGSGTLSRLHTWHEYERLLSMVTFVGVPRPHSAFGSDPSPLADAPGGTLEVHIPAMDISSTEIRQRVAHGRTIEYLVPLAVKEIITTRGLYRD